MSHLTIIFFVIQYAATASGDVRGREEEIFLMHQSLTDKIKDSVGIHSQQLLNIFTSFNYKILKVVQSTNKIYQLIFDSELNQYNIMSFDLETKALVKLPLTCSGMDDPKISTCDCDSNFCWCYLQACNSFYSTKSLNNPIVKSSLQGKKISKFFISNENLENTFFIEEPHSFSALKGGEGENPLFRTSNTSHAERLNLSPENGLAQSGANARDFLVIRTPEYATGEYPNELVRVTESGISTVLPNCKDLKKSHNVFYILCQNNGNETLYVSLDGRKFFQCRFQEDLTFQNFTISKSYHSSIFLQSCDLVQKNARIWRAYISPADSTLSFVKIHVYDEYHQECEFQFFSNAGIQGLVFLSKANRNWMHLKNMISFNFGASWHASTIKKVIKNNKYHTCETETCSHKLFTQQYHSSHHRHSHAPWLVVLNGELYVENQGVTYGLFVSRDAGLTWSVLSSLHEVKYIVSHTYSIIISHAQYSKKIGFSLDEGQTWADIAVYKSSIVHSQLIDLSDSTNIHVLLVGFFFKNYIAVLVDFSQIKNSVCHQDDLISWTLTTPSGICILGKSYTFVSRKDSKFCVISGDLEKINTQSCSCHLSDLECQFNYQMIEGLCLQPNSSEPPEARQCGNQIFSGGNIHERYIWKNTFCSRVDEQNTTDITKVENSDFCIDPDATYFVLAKKRFVLKIWKLSKTNGKPTEISYQIWKKGDYEFSDIAIDFKLKSFYSVLNYRLYRSSYVTTGIEMSSNWKLLDSTLTAFQIEFDSVSGNLFFINLRYQLWVMSVESKLRKSIFKNYQVKSFKTYLNKGTILLQLRNHSLLLCNLLETGCFTVVTAQVESFAYDGQSKIYFRENKSSRINYVTVNDKEQSENQPKNKFVDDHGDSQIYIHDELLIVATEHHTYVYDSNAELMWKSISKLVFSRILPFPSAIHDSCFDINCPGICVVVENKPYCICQDDYSYQNGVCRCKWFNCTGHCDEEDFVCGDLSCLRTNRLCNGRNDCPNEEDEKICTVDAPRYTKKQCEKDQFDCRNGVCINSTKVCDGKRDCTNNLDEDSCRVDENSSCREDEVPCATIGCVAIDLLCKYDGGCDSISQADDIICACRITHTGLCPQVLPISPELKQSLPASPHFLYIWLSIMLILSVLIMVIVYLSKNTMARVVGAPFANFYRKYRLIFRHRISRTESMQVLMNPSL